MSGECHETSAGTCRSPRPIPNCVLIAPIREIPMWIQNFFQSGTSPPTRARATRRRAPASLLCLEPLEDRFLLSFSAPVNYAVGAGPRAVVVADVNNDGRPDLAVANYQYQNWYYPSVLL